MMKRLSFALLIGTALALMLGCSTLPPWKPVPTGQSAVYGKIENTSGLIQFIAFSDDPGIAALSIGYTFGRFAPQYALILDRPGREALKAALSKYLDWAGLASENRVEITKEIATIVLPQMQRSGNSWQAEGTRELAFIFVSRFDRNGVQRISLVLRSSSFLFGRDQFTLNDEQAREFNALLQDDAMENGYREAKKKQDTIDMFR
jgi:hypothetical protein